MKKIKEKSASITDSYLELWNSLSKIFWLKRNSDYTDNDFIKAVYKLNDQTGELEILDLLENLARFLCGYAVQVNCRKGIENMTTTQQHNYFQNQIEDVDSMITDEMIQNKIDFIKETLNIN